MHEGNGIICYVAKNRNVIKITGKSISDHFVMQDNKLYSITSTMNETCVNHIHQILDTLDKRNIGILTTLYKGWQQWYYRSKQELFLSYGF